MDLKTLAADLKALQTRQEKYEDLFAAGEGDSGQQALYKEMLAFYRTETAKVRQVYLDMIKAVKSELGNKE